MSSPEYRWFDYNDVDEARERIFGYLQLTSHKKVIYFDGWEGFGASAVLRSIAEVLPSRRATPDLCFDKIIYVDCSEWKNRRAVQRAIAEELKLDRSVMDILDEQDADDDFRRVDESSRDKIESVAEVIDQALSGTRFMMIFLNGSDDEVDVSPLGIPPFARYGRNTNIMIWTFKRSFLTMRRLSFEVVDKLRYTHVFFSRVGGISSSMFRELLRHEAATIVARIPFIQDINPMMVTDCCLYELLLHYSFHTTTMFDWVAHASNYWICDGIIQGDRARDISNALHREIKWEGDASLLDFVIKNCMEDLKPSLLVVKDGDVYKEGPYRWISVTSRNMKLHGMETIPAATSSFFLAFKRSKHPPTLPNGLFEHSRKLGVLILYCCAFDFASPPFHKCRGLRFLGLDHCTDSKTGEGVDHTEWAFLYSMWVLDLRYTDWNEILSQKKMDLMANVTELNTEGVRCWQYITHLQGRLPNLQRLRILKPACQGETSKDVDNSFIDKTRMEILDLSGNSNMKCLPTSLSNASSLQLLILDGCDGLENIGAHGRLPPSLKYFSFDGYGPASRWTQTVQVPPRDLRPSTTTNNEDISISYISLEGCTQLENLFLRGLPNLLELDLSGTAIKIFDFKTMVVQVPRLKRLFLVGCQHLRAIRPWHVSDSEVQPNLELLCVDTRAGIGCPRPFIDKNKCFRFQMHVVGVDARLVRSLLDFIQPYYDTKKDVYFSVHITSSPVYGGVAQLEATCKDETGPSDQESLQQLVPASRYIDVLSMVGDAPMQAFPQPPATKLDRHVEIAQGCRCVGSVLENELGQLMSYYAESLHVHDVSISAALPEERFWDYLRWCCVERCPKLDTVFRWSGGFYELETIWVSDLLMARSIWVEVSRDGTTFTNLQHLHLRSCPSLQFVLPLCVSSFPSLETLHIIHCGDLKHVFVLDEKSPEEIAVHGVRFPKLITIHLHDLPSLQQICEAKMVAPALETIKIRGCWSLRRLPAVAARGGGEKKPAIEIEKDVWDALEWDAGHHPDHFEAPVHSRYYKKKLPRVSFLRSTLHCNSMVCFLPSRRRWMLLSAAAAAAATCVWLLCVLPMITRL